jgi:hypothetical protein
MFKVQKLHLDYLKKAVDVYGKINIHADGNMYVNTANTDGSMSNSDFHKEFSDPKQEGADHVLTFSKGDNLPETVQEINEMFIAAKAREKYEDNNEKEVTKFTGLNVDSEKDNEPKQRGRKPNKL